MQQFLRGERPLVDSPEQPGHLTLPRAIVLASLILFGWRIRSLLGNSAGNRFLTRQNAILISLFGDFWP